MPRKKSFCANFVLRTCHPKLVFSPHLPWEIVDAKFRQFNRFPSNCRRRSIHFDSILCHFQSVSVSLNQFQTILISFTQFDSVKTQQFIDNRKVGKTTRNETVSRVVSPRGRFKPGSVQTSFRSVSQKRVLHKRRAYLYCNTPPICIAILSVPLSPEDREMLQHSSHLSRLFIVLLYASQWYHNISF